MSAKEPSSFLNYEIVKRLKDQFGTPLYVYDRKALESQAQKALAFPNLYGLTPRFAMKALPNAAVLKIFDKLGLSFDASSGFEVRRAIAAGINPSSISLSSQELPHDIKDLIDLGIEFNACSLHQLESFGRHFPGGSCGIRFNPGLGSGGTGKTNVGGPAASFGIWYELINQVKEVVQKHGLKISRIHTHIGSGSDPATWQSVSKLSLDLVRQFQDVTTLNLGGGYKVGRMSTEKSTDLQVVGHPVAEAFKNFAEETGRELKLEIEPGTFLVANAGALVSTVQDIVTTGESGNTFLKLDSGMTEILRPSIYGAQHPIIVHSNRGDLDTKDSTNPGDSSSADHASVIVVGHCCESGDLLTCEADDSEVLKPRMLHHARIGDIVSVEGAGAYCSSMSAKNYNSFPEAAEVMLEADGRFSLIRRRQTLEQIYQNEVLYEP